MATDPYPFFAVKQQECDAIKTPIIDPSVLFRTEYHDDLYPTLKVLRDHYPAYNIPGTNTWMLTRYDDVAAAFRDPETFSSTENAQGIGAIVGRSLIEMDGDEHKRRRAIVAPVFVGKNLKAMMPIVVRYTMSAIEDFTRKHAQRIGESAAQAGEIDIVDDFAPRLPLNVIMDVLDLPQEAHELFHDWYPAMIAGMISPDHREAGQAANAEFHDYIEPLLEERSANPGDDLISRLISAEFEGHRLSREELKSFASLLFVGGAETTDKAISNLWYWLLSNPEQLAAVQRDPDLLELAFFEMMRIHSPSKAAHRCTTREVTLHGEVIPAGAIILLSMYGANRDDRVFADPDRFDIFRDDLDLKFGSGSNGKSGHLGFGLGAHFCIGYQLAQTETIVGTRELLKRMKNPRFKPGSNPKPIAMTTESLELLVAFDEISA